MNDFSSPIRLRNIGGPANETVLVNEECLAALAAFRGFDDFWNMPVRRTVKELADRAVYQAAPGGGGFFLKKFRREPRQRQRRAGSKIQFCSEGGVEFNHYCLFRERGLATVIPAAFGERRHGDGTVESFLLTRDFSPFVQLERLIRHYPQLLDGKAAERTRRRIIAAMAGYARRMHDRGLNHRDFNATHILLHGVDAAAGPLVLLFDLQRVDVAAGPGWRWPLKTLADLEYTLRENKVFTPEDRRLLHLRYFGKQEFSAADIPRRLFLDIKVAAIARHTAKLEKRKKRPVALPRRLSFLPLDPGNERPLSSQRVAVCCRRLLRRVPASREVYEGRLGQREVVIKTFVSNRRADRHCRREARGLDRLRRLGIAAPAPIFCGVFGQGARVLVMEKIEAAQSLERLVSSGRSRADEAVIAAAATLAAMHDRGVLQKDLHLGNFLVSRRSQGATPRISVIDPAEMTFHRRPIGKKAAMRQLARLCAPFIDASRDGAGLAGRLVEEYAARRYGQTGAIDLQAVTETALRIKKRQLSKTLKKYQRANTRHRLLEDKGCFALFTRALVSREAAAMIVETVKSRPDTSHIKAGGGMYRVIRYGKTPAFFPSRARREWLARYKAVITGGGAEPAGFIEVRRGKDKRRSFLIEAV